MSPKTKIYTLQSRREHSIFQLKQKLTTQGFNPTEIQHAIDELCANGTVSDSRFTTSFIRYRQSQGYGPLRIRQELQLRGIAQEMIEDHLDITDNAWFTEVHRVWQKRFRGKHPADYKEKSKQVRFLQYRGFTQEHIQQVFGHASNLSCAEK